MEDYFNRLRFSSFCEACESIVSRLNKKKKYKYFREYINYHRNKCGEDATFPLLRLFLPQLERERGPYGVKEYNLANTYIRILCLPKNGSDAQRLLNYRNPSNVRNSDIIGDFAEVAYWILRNKCPKSTDITIGEINDNLDSIAMKHAEHDPRAVDDILTSLLRKMSAEEQKWFIRILLKSMHLGLSTKQMLYIHHPDSSEVFDLSNSLLKVCTTLKSPSVRYHELEINLFEPFRPMLSERSDVTKFNLSEPLLLETKYDGDRFQLHYSQGKFKYFSRNGYDYSANFGEDENGYFTSLVKKQMSPSVESMIMDGECLGWNTKTFCMVTKASNVDFKLLKVGNVVQPFYVAFDLLYYNGEVLTNKTLLERKTILDTTFADLEGTIMKAPRKLITAEEDIINALNAAIDQCEEGIILKKPESIYKPNSRRYGWYKIKPEYTDGGLIDLDLLILGGYYGQGKQKGKVSHFMMGLAVPGNNGETPSQFQSLCRVGSGYSMPELSELSNKLATSWHKTRPHNIPEAHLFSKEKPDVWILPQDSCILQIKATEVVNSNVYYVGSTLKFVRVQRIRYDKPWYECMTTQEFQTIKQAYQGKLTVGPIANSVQTSKKKKVNLVEPLFAAAENLNSLNCLTNILESKEFCVISGSKDLMKEDIEKMIAQNGGRLKYVPGSETFCLIAGDVNLRVKNLVKSGKHNVAHFSWLQECLEQKKLVEWTPLALAGTTLMGKSELYKKFDKFGDSYTQNIPAEKLASIMKKMNTEVFMDSNALQEIDSLLYHGSNPYALFRNIMAYFIESSDDNSNIPSRIQLAKMVFEFHGGICCSYVDDTAKLIIVDETCNSPCDCKVATSLAGNNLDINIISSSWIFESVAAGKQFELIHYVFDPNITLGCRNTNISLS